MSAVTRMATPGGIVHNALFRYYPEIQAVARHVAAGRAAPMEIPLVPEGPSRALAEFSDVTDIALTQVEPGLHVLDLMRNPGTRTAQTMASLLMVARAADHIRRTGEGVLLLTPTSGNKGTALRDAVARAYASGLAYPELLRIVTVVPPPSRGKLRSCPLDGNAQLRRANPVVLADVDGPAGVEPLSGHVAATEADRVLDRSGFRLWHTPDLDNYRVADATRAFVEAALLPITGDSPPRLHLSAVSSASGLLGYHLGHQVLSAGLPGWASPAWHPGFFLVQQLATADMVTSLLGAGPPVYERSADQVWRQRRMPEFPPETDDPHEVIDPTFCTKEPPTRASVNAIVGRHGGGGVVVARRECAQRLPRVRAMAAEAGIAIDVDPDRIGEWSLVKALTGALVARERGLVDARVDVVVHASGHYGDESVPPMRDDHIANAATGEDLARLVMRAALA